MSEHFASCPANTSGECSCRDLVETQSGVNVPAELELDEAASVTDTAAVIIGGVGGEAAAVEPEAEASSTPPLSGGFEWGPCLRCGHRWNSRKPGGPKPVWCAKCRAVNWDSAPRPYSKRSKADRPKLLRRKKRVKPGAAGTGVAGGSIPSPGDSVPALPSAVHHQASHGLRPPPTRIEDL